MRHVSSGQQFKNPLINRILYDYIDTNSIYENVYVLYKSVLFNYLFQL